MEFQTRSAMPSASFRMPLRKGVNYKYGQS